MENKRVTLSDEREYNVMLTTEEGSSTHRGVRASDLSMAQDAGVGRGSAVTQSDIVSGW